LDRLCEEQPVLRGKVDEAYLDLPDDFDFGSGNQEQDRAMVWRRNNSAPLPERLHCRLL